MLILFVSLVLFSNPLFAEDIKSYNIFKAYETSTSIDFEDDISSYCKDYLNGVTIIESINVYKPNFFKYLDIDANSTASYDENIIVTATCKIDSFTFNADKINIYLASEKGTGLTKTITNICSSLYIETLEKSPFDDKVYQKYYYHKVLVEVPSLLGKDNRVYNFFNCVKNKYIH